FPPLGFWSRARLETPWAASWLLGWLSSGCSASMRHELIVSIVRSVARNAERSAARAAGCPLRVPERRHVNRDDVQPIKRMASAVEEVDVRLVHNADLLHGLSQVGGLGKRPRTAEIFCLEQQDDFIQILHSPEKMLLCESRFGAFGEVGVVSTLPL